MLKRRKFVQNEKKHFQREIRLLCFVFRLRMILSEIKRIWQDKNNN